MITCVVGRRATRIRQPPEQPQEIVIGHPLVERFYFSEEVRKFVESCVNQEIITRLGGPKCGSVAGSRCAGKLGGNALGFHGCNCKRDFLGAVSCKNNFDI